MSLPELKGKTILVATNDETMAGYNFAHALEDDLGAKVVFSAHGTVTPHTAPLIAEEARTHNPPIDAIIIHNSLIEDKEQREAAIRLTNELKGACPVIVCDTCNSKAAIQPVQDAGAKYINVFELEEPQIVAGIADAIAQHGKPGRTPGGK